jgi:hypothetical protein
MCLLGTGTDQRLVSCRAVNPSRPCFEPTLYTYDPGRWYHTWIAWRNGKHLTQCTHLLQKKTKAKSNTTHSRHEKQPNTRAHAILPLASIFLSGDRQRVTGRSIKILVTDQSILGSTPTAGPACATSFLLFHFPLCTFYNRAKRKSRCPVLHPRSSLEGGLVATVGTDIHIHRCIEITVCHRLDLDL